jgi:hypothetical protein
MEQQWLTKKKREKKGNNADIKKPSVAQAMTKRL